MKRVFLIAVISLLAGCVTAKKIYTPDGRQGFAVSCPSASGKGWDGCFEKASEVCGAKGYDIIDRASDNQAGAGGFNGAFGASTNTSRTLIIACKP